MSDNKKINLFLCTCNGEINYPADFEAGPDTEVIKHEKLCGEAGRKLVAKAAGEVVIAGCTERIAEQHFAGSKAAFVNVREQGSYVGAAEDKIHDLIQSSLAGIRGKREFEAKVFRTTNKSVLIIGAGVAGLEAARQIAAAGITVYLLEKEAFVGGVVGKLDRLYPEGTPNAHTLGPLITSVLKTGNVHILTGARLRTVEGELGNYRVKITQGTNYVPGDLAIGRRCREVCPVEVVDEGITRKAVYYHPTYPNRYAIDRAACTRCGKCREISEDIDLDFTATERELDVGAIVVATGLKPYPVDHLEPYGYGRYENVYTPLEFERKMTAEEIDPASVAIINCVGSRDENHLPYCSRVCCFLGLKEARLIKDRNPAAEVSVFYIDMRAYGQLETFYSALREHCGIRFIQGKPSEVLPRDGGLIVRAEDVQLGEMVEVKADSVVLCHGYRPDAATLQILGVSADNDAFPTAYISASRSPDSNPRGIFICGGAAFPKDVTDTVSEARNVAVEVINALRSDTIEAPLSIPVINSAVCAELSCRLCVSTCPYGAIKMVGEELRADPSFCMGCGTCTATCPAGANQLQGETNHQLLARVKALSKKDTIIAFLCRWSAYPAADLSGYEGITYPDSVRIIRVPCTGRIGNEAIMQAFAGQAKGVLIGGCYPCSCHYLSGNLKARRREFGLEGMIEQLGIPPQSLRIEWFGIRESKKLARVLEEMDNA